MSTVAVVGGTGTTQVVRGLPREEMRVRTMHGPVDMMRVWAAGSPFYFLSRHGVGHHAAPHNIAHEANIAALRSVGVTRAFALYAVGGLLEDLHPGTAVILSDLVECSRAGAMAGGHGGPIRHTDMSEPFCPTLRALLASTLSAGANPVVPQGTYCHVSGPRYETPAEVRLFAAWGGTVVGMTALPEAELAREAGICWAAVACVTNYGVGLRSEPVSHPSVASSMRETLARIGPALFTAVEAAREAPPCRHRAGDRS